MKKEQPEPDRDNDPFLRKLLVIEIYDDKGSDGKFSVVTAINPLVFHKYYREFDFFYIQNQNKVSFGDELELDLKTGALRVSRGPHLQYYLRTEEMPAPVLLRLMEERDLV